MGSDTTSTGDRGLAAENAQLKKDNAEMARKLAKLPPVGPDKGTALCFRRGNEAVFRKGALVSDGYVDAIPHPAGQVLFGLIEYGEPAGTKETAQRFTTNRPHDPNGGPDSWHLPEECPCGHDPAACPFSREAPAKTQAP